VTATDLFLAGVLDGGLTNVMLPARWEWAHGKHF